MGHGIIQGDDVDEDVDDDDNDDDDDSEDNDDDDDDDDDHDDVNDDDNDEYDDEYDADDADDDYADDRTKTHWTQHCEHIPMDSKLQTLIIFVLQCSTCFQFNSPVYMGTLTSRAKIIR